MASTGFWMLEISWLDEKLNFTSLHTISSNLIPTCKMMILWYVFSTRIHLRTMWDLLWCNICLLEEPVRYGVFHKAPIPINIRGNVHRIHSNVRTVMCCHSVLVHTLPKHHLYIYHCEVAISTCGKVLVPPGPLDHLYIL